MSKLHAMETPVAVPLVRIEWNNRGQPETPARGENRVISLRRLAFFQPIAVFAAARFCGAATM